MYMNSGVIHMKVENVRSGSRLFEVKSKRKRGSALFSFIQNEAFPI